MNVIFTDFDGPFSTLNQNFHPLESEDAVEKRVKILSDICKLYDCKVVIESAHKSMIDEETLEIIMKQDWLVELFDLFKKYDIEVIGITPQIINENNENTFSTIWKEKEILEYLKKHPEIEHICVIDDDDLVSIPAKERGDYSKSDLNMFREFLITPLSYSSENPDEVGLQEKHIEEAGRILEKSIKGRIW